MYIHENVKPYFTKNKKNNKEIFTICFVPYTQLGYLHYHSTDFTRFTDFVLKYFYIFIFNDTQVASLLFVKFHLTLTLFCI